MVQDKLYTLEENTKDYTEYAKKFDTRGAIDVEFNNMLGVESSIDDIELPKDQVNSVQGYNLEKTLFYKRNELLLGNSAKDIKLTEDLDSFIKKHPGVTENEVKNNLMYDAFSLLYKPNPTITATNKMKKPYDMINKLIREVVQDDNFKNIKNTTSYDYNNSLATSSSMTDKIISQHAYLFDKMNEQDKQQKELEDLLNQLSGMKDLDGNCPQSMQDTIDNLKSRKTDVEQEIQQTEKEITDYEQQAENFSGETIKQTIQKAVEEGAEEANSIKDLLDTLKSSSSKDKGGKGGNGFSENLLNKKDIGNLKKLTSDSYKFQKLINLLGSMVSDASSKAKKKKCDNGTIPDSISTGNNLPDILSSSLCYLANPKTKPMFYKNFVEKTLLIKEKIDFKNQGPIIVCLDKSGSMDSRYRDVWGAALSVACLQSAKIQKRDFRLIRFNHTATYDDYYPKDKNNNSLSYILDVCTTESNGGTRFGPPIELAMKAINTNKFKDASILFLTDGSSYMDSDVLARALKTKKEKKYRMYTVYIGGENDEDLDKLSDKTYPLSRLFGKEANKATEEIFTEISKM